VLLVPASPTGMTGADLVLVSATVHLFHGEMAISFWLIGGPTAILEIGGLRLITDPTFDDPQTFVGAGTEGTDGITKTSGPAVPMSAVGTIDVALVSHDHHIDNLDVSGRALLETVSRVFTTDAGAVRLGGVAEGLEGYKWATVPLPGGGDLRVTGVPAHHGPDGVWQNAGPVTGFILQADGQPTVYISGDNSDLELVREIAAAFPDIELAVLFAGGAKFKEIGGVYLTMSNEMAVEAARILPGALIVPVHADGWAHFSQTAHELVELFTAEGIGDRILAPTPGEKVDLDDVLAG